MIRRFGKALLLAVIVATMFASTAMAKSDNARKQLVVLGDSIAYGYNLGVNNDTASEYAFPYVMKETAKLKVSDLAIPKLTSTQLLDLVKQDKSFRKDLKHADYVVLEIGNNDLLQVIAAAKNADGSLNVGLMQQTLQQSALPNLLNNLKNTILEVRALTDAPIVIYNVYNPYQVTDQPMHTLSNLLLTQFINNNLAAVVQSLTGAGVEGLVIADAFSAFANNQLTYVRQNDIHPTIEGQRKLAEIGAAALGL